MPCLLTLVVVLSKGFYKCGDLATFSPGPAQVSQQLGWELRAHDGSLHLLVVPPVREASLCTMLVCSAAGHASTRATCLSN